jgi:hypothetical protein
MIDHPLSRVRERQKSLESRKREALEGLRREPDLIHAERIQFLAHALVLPSDDPENTRLFDAQVEAIPIKVATAHEEAAGAIVKDVSKPARRERRVSRTTPVLTSSRNTLPTVNKAARSRDVPRLVTLN